MVMGNDVLEHIYKLPFADGIVYYKVDKLRNNLVFLKKIENHPDNPDNYGESKRVIPYQQAIHMVKMDKLFKKSALER